MNEPRRAGTGGSQRMFFILVWWRPQSQRDGCGVRLPPIPLRPPSQQSGDDGWFEAMRTGPFRDGHAVPVQPGTRLGGGSEGGHVHIV